MRSLSKSLKLPSALWEAITLRWKDLGYKGFGAYVLGLIRYDLLSQKPHEVTRHWADCPLHVQDDLDDGLARIVASGEAQRGSYLRKIIAEVIAEQNSGLAVEDVAAKLSEKVLSFSRKK